MRETTKLKKMIVALKVILPADKPTENDKSGKGNWNQLELLAYQKYEELRAKYFTATGI